MFNGKRSFNGRQGEQIYNEELYMLYEILKHFLDSPDNARGPKSDMEKAGALWLDMKANPGFSHLMYRNDDGEWNPIFDDWFRLIKDIRSADKPISPEEGQLWINDNGVLNWYNGSEFVPIKSRAADTIDFTTNAFENFLVIDPLKMTGSYIVENIAKIASEVSNITKWNSSIQYKDKDVVYYTDSNNNTRFYRILSNYEQVDNFVTAIDNNTVEVVKTLSQFLIPSETLDKIFLEGYYFNEEKEIIADVSQLENNKKAAYERVSDVCIQISLDIYQGKTIAAVHVNPIALKKIKKRIIEIPKDKNNLGIIEISSENTEYYAMKGSYGVFLNKNTDYISRPNGIRIINDDIIKNFDYIYSITYYFENRIKNEGKLLKGTIDLSNQTCIWIGKLDEGDNLLVFAQGLCLEDNWYSYDSNSGLVKFNGYDKDGNLTKDPSKITKTIFESKTDVAIMRFKKKQPSTLITSSNMKNKNAELQINNDFENPLIFVQGENLNFELKDYIKVNDKITIENADPGSSYCAVDTVRITEDGQTKYNMYVRSGKINSNATIPIADTDTDIINETCKPLVFVDGFYISSKDIELTEENNKKVIKIHGLTNGQEYVLLKDTDDDMHQLLFDGEICYTTIPMEQSIDDAIVYVNNTIVIDGDACVSSSIKDDNAVNNEIRSIISGGEQAWYKYYKSSIPTKCKWVKINDETKSALLDLSTSGYSVESNVINLLQNFGEVKCTYYGYVFADNIEKPLVKGYTTDCEKVTTNDGEMMFYKINTKHSYSMGRNALSVWMNGIRQIIKEDKKIEKMIINGKETEIERQGFLIPIPTDAHKEELEIPPTCFYIIEEPETGELYSCNMENIDESIGINTYNTKDVVLSPGMVRIFIDGYRQPNNTYVISNMNSFTLIDPVTSKNNKNILIKDKNGNNVVTQIEKTSEILVEVRRDYKLKEETVQVTEDSLANMKSSGNIIFDSKTTFFDNKTLPEDLFLSRASEINIYINGACYGKDFIKEANQDMIVLTNLNITKIINVNDKITFEWR